MTGSCPVEAAGSANTSLVPPPGRVKMTIRTTATTAAVAMIATRGADRHQGPPAPAPPPRPPPPPPPPPPPLPGPPGGGR
ncbi:hypothetical protein CP981_30360 [Streptomyces platensis]|uniref:Uncharacterized protein n=1 Tax=Streptomyces platensis TaxID=58346 RepID=A0AAE6TPQ2_STRPT|nr:hypothetical protein CP981_30360 [Streptomyces platensis]